MKTIHIEEINIEDYNYELPDERIAKYPLPQRDQSKLLIYRDGNISEGIFSQLNQYLPEKSLLVFNNTKVIQARMLFRKETGARIEVFCLEPYEPAEYALALSQNQSCVWLCMLGNSKRWKEGKLSCEIDDSTCTVERLQSFGDTHLIRFEWNNPSLCFADILEKYGELPIPPYLNRKTEVNDKETYQTVYSKIKGSVAAPTAGLHFTESVFDSLDSKKIDREELTLHVGAGTFKPVKSKSLANHEMHAEFISVKRETIEKLLKNQGKIFAVGTTSVRTLETLYYIGAILALNPDAKPEELTITQWFPYDKKNNYLNMNQALQNILNYLNRNKLKTLTTHTQILIAPGYTFKLVNGIITNFHQPKSTLLLLISAFVNGDWKSIYQYALEHNFRFLSYGDSSLLMAATLPPQ